MTYKLKVRHPDGRIRLCGTGTHDRARYDAMRAWILALKRGAARRLDILAAIVQGDATLPDAFDLRRTPDAILALRGARDLAPYVERWHLARDPGPAYLMQVRQFIPPGVPCLATQLTAGAIRQWLANLDVADPTRNRYRAALSHFCEYLVEQRVLASNPTREVRGWSEGRGREGWYSLAEAGRILAHLPPGDVRVAVALAMTAGLEWQVLTRLRAVDVVWEGDQLYLWADGEKNTWRRRWSQALLLHEVPGAAALLRGALTPAEAETRFLPTLRDSRTLTSALARAARVEGLPLLGLHDQRHTFAVNALRAGHRPELVASCLGHRDTHLLWTRYGRYATAGATPSLAAERGAPLSLPGVGA